MNHAVGGSFASDLVPQATAAALSGSDRVAVSVGTNDAAPWKQVGLDRVLTHVDEFLAGVGSVADRLVFVTPPGVDQSRLRGANDRTNADVARYSSRLSEAFEDTGATVLDAAALLVPLGAAAFVDDGVHLSGDGYDVLLPALRAALDRA